MTVALTLSESIDGSAIADSLSGGGSGIDLGSVVNGAYAPISGTQSDNLGRQELFIRHDAVDDPITDLKTYLASFSQTYGGRTGSNPTTDFNAIIALGNASDGQKSNDNGSGGGIRIDMDADISQSAVSPQFDHATNGVSIGGTGTVEIFGRANTAGINLVNAVTMQADAMVIDSDQSSGGSVSAGFIPTAPVDGQLGKNGDTALGDNAHFGMRVYLPTSQSDGGIFQCDLVASYSFTS